MKNSFIFAITFLSLSVFCSTSFAQNQTVSKKLSEIASVKNNGNWLTFKKNDIKPAEVFTLYKEAFGLSANDNMILKKENYDGLGFKHLRYEQTYNGVKVDGAEFIIHSKNDNALTANGKLVTGLNINTNPSVSANQAIQNAKNFVNAEKYMWEDPKNEAILKQITGNSLSTYYPKAELVIFDRSFSQKSSNYKLAYKVNIYSETPLSNQIVYIDAMNGEVLHRINKIINTDKKGTAVTKYSGNKRITFDSVSSNLYRLREVGRGSGVETWDLNNAQTYTGAVDFTDTDTLWNNVNAQMDEVAGDAHWGAEMTYDFYKERHNWNSYDNNGSKMVSYVHYGSNYVNAFWDGVRMTYGDGNGTSYLPFTAIDICGHEITHAVTQNTADLIYQDESGALNESFSDMFGACILKYGRNDTTRMWRMGSDITSNHLGLRNMRNPQEFGDPDTYHGSGWSTDPLDNGGVHTNSGVPNFWFYLLAMGGTGTNDKGTHYSVSGIGLGKADSIAFRTLSQYLTPSSAFIDARNASIQAATDIYGQCSNEVIQVAAAWYAVGVGMAINDNDLSMLDVISPKTACGMTNEAISVRFIYNGCSVPIPSGDTLFVGYKVDGGLAVIENKILNSNINGGDTVTYLFAQTADVHLIGTHHVKTWVHYKKDTLFQNDTIADYQFQNNVYQNVDVRPISVLSPTNKCFLGNSNITVRVGFYGCDSIPAGESIPLNYSINSGSTVTENFVLSHKLITNQTIDLTFSQPFDFSTPGYYNFDVWTSYPDDTIGNNHYTSYKLKHPIHISAPNTFIGFEAVAVSDSINIRIRQKAHVYIQPAAHLYGAKGLRMTGTNPMDIIDSVQFPTGFNVWNINGFMSAKVDFCIDATAWDSTYMSFDLKQTFGKVAYEQFVGPGDYTFASSLRILVNDSAMIGNTYNPDNSGTFVWNPHCVDLNAYSGHKFMVTFETRCLAKDTTVSGFSMVMDNAYIDDVVFSEKSHAGVNEVTTNNNDIKIYPNPVSEKFYIEFNSSKNQNVKLEIFDIFGKTIEITDWNVIQGENRYAYYMKNVPSGIYNVRISSDKGFSNCKFIKQ